MTHYTLGLCFSLIIAFVGYRLKYLSVSGIAGAVIIGTAVYGTGQLTWAIPLLIFFFSSSILSKISGPVKQEADKNYEKRGQRDIFQVFANGALPFACVLISPMVSDYHLLTMAVYGACAASNADTWATEGGVFSKKQPVSILSFKHVVYGTSGGVSLLGFVFSFLGAAVVAFPLIFITGDGMAVAAVSVAGFAGSVADSLLGGSVQAGYFCPVCNENTERSKHSCGTETKRIKGFLLVNNDAVNAAANIIGGALAIIIFLLFT